MSTASWSGLRHLVQSRIPSAQTPSRSNLGRGGGGEGAKVNRGVSKGGKKEEGRSGEGGRTTKKGKKEVEDGRCRGREGDSEEGDRKEGREGRREGRREGEERGREGGGEGRRGEGRGMGRGRAQGGRE